MISVIVPVYEQPDLLRSALESVVDQTYDDWEAVVVDDASTADHERVVEEFDERIRLVTHETNRGASAARNTGIDHAEGEYVAFLDADDAWAETKLERQLSVFERGSDRLGLVYTGFVQYETDGSEWVRHPAARGDIYVQELERDRVHPTSTVMVRRDVLDEVGGFDTTLPSRQDYDLWIRVTERYEVDYVDDVLVHKTEREDSISKNFDARVRGDLAVFETVRDRAGEFGPLTRTKILSYHHHVIGRDYDSRGDRWPAVRHLGLAILRYPLRPISYAMFVIALLNIDRNGPLVSRAKRFVR